MRVQPAGQRQRGAALLEFVIASSISGLLVIAVTAIIASSFARWQWMAARNEVEQNTYRALQLLREDIFRAGQWGFFADPRRVDISDAAGLDIACGEAGWFTDLEEPIKVYRGVNPFADTCIADEDYSENSDLLSVRYASHAVNKAHLENARIYLAGSPFAAKMFRQDSAAAEAENLAAELIKPTQAGVVSYFQFATHIYFIRPCASWQSTEQCQSTPISVLYREVLGTSGFRSEALAPGIEYFFADAAVDNDADRRIDRWLQPDAVTDWSKVIAMRLYLIGKSHSRSNKADIVQEFQAGQRVLRFADGYWRKLVSATVVLRNPGRQSAQAG